MKVLLLGPERPRLVAYLESIGDEVKVASEPLEDRPELLDWAEFILSYGYRHIVRPDVLQRFPERTANLHISLLPWNRGSDPNLWSFLEDTPKGVTIHRVDEGIDTGDILAQASVEMSEDETLATSYEKLTRYIEELFVEVWPSLRSGNLTPLPQQGEGSYHRSHDKEPYLGLLSEGWETPVEALVGKAKHDHS